MIRRARTVVMAAVSALALAACHGEPGSIVAPIARWSVLPLAGDDGHEEPDPSVPPTCHGFTATIWATMPAELIPRGASIRPAARGEDEHLLAAGHEDGDDEDASGYVISGTNGRDVIVGSPQRDSISGNNGDDIVCADPVHGEDEEGGEGSGSTGQGGGGPDQVWGGNGDDSIYGGGGPDSLYGGNGNDVLYGGGGPDVLFGERGDDQLFGGGGNDTLDGGSGVNVIDEGIGHAADR